ncbi:MAG: N-6 DNA methylase [Bryobacterales bacterium]|nr:N-6 DNA methylase [Bryobacterales bacterium]
MPRLDPEARAHLDWLGFVQPQGLVVSVPALIRNGAVLNRRDTEGQKLLSDCIEKNVFRSGGDPEPYLPDFEQFARGVLGWKFSPKAFARATDADGAIHSAEVALPEHEDVLRPDFAVRHWPVPKDGSPEWQLLVRVVQPRQAFDSEERGRGTLEATAHGRMERMLRATGVEAGLLFNGRAIRLISAPRGESSGWIDFIVADMLLTAGRPIVAAMRLLLRQARLLTVPHGQRITALLKESRKYQSVVSERLAEQVLHGLYEMVRGFQAADDASGGTLLRDALEKSPDTVYRALLTVMLRLVFLLYAEQRDLLPDDQTFVRFYSLAGLHERLRADAAQYPDTMDQRYGAWPQLAVLFRMIHDGARSGSMTLPARQGALFDPDRFPFLAAVPCIDSGPEGEQPTVPLVSDGTVFRVLEKLVVLDGERISYRALDVEQIGSVYETMMGFRLEIATGPSISIKAVKKKNGAPSTIDIDALLAARPTGRRKWIQDRTDRKITQRVNRMVGAAISLEDMLAALDSVVDKNATPDLVADGAMILQPSEERRRSGSHYTPRELTEPIVRKALEPVLNDLQGTPDGGPTPAQILEVKVCDPAMGSGAFLVEACRQLGDALVEAWVATGTGPQRSSGEDRVMEARRVVAQKCLYGVDRNVMAVDLAKMSLWLITLAKDHPLTFVDHALRHGDSLLGLTREQVEVFHWRGGKKRFAAGFEALEGQTRIERVAEARREIQAAGRDAPRSELSALLARSETELANVRLLGDLVVSAFFEGRKVKERKRVLDKYAQAVMDGDLAGFENPLVQARHAAKPLAAFHWEIEFPEVFDRERPGFDCIVGNPPFAGKNSVIAANAGGYGDWLKEMHAGSHGNADLAAHFFRRAFSLLRDGGNLGLIATNTIAQGDTRSTGLRWICTNGGEIYDATKRKPWPGMAAVIVSVVHIRRGKPDGSRSLDGIAVPAISAYLTVGSTHQDPARLKVNRDKSFVGSYILGMGFTFDDRDKKGVASSLAEMKSLIETNPKNQEAIFPYIGGKELNKRPTHAHHRYVINFWDYPLRRKADESQSWFGMSTKTQSGWRRSGVVPHDYPMPVAADWPGLLEIIERKVRPDRRGQNRKALRDRWWHYAEKRPGLYRTIKGLDRVLSISRVGQHASFAFLPAGIVYAESLIIFPFRTYSAFCVLQSRLHEFWARWFGSSMKDDLRYTPSDCFETFPFPRSWMENRRLEDVGKSYYEYRAALMESRGEGLTKIYNRFHDRYNKDPEIVRLRTLHDEMDRSVLAQYGWDDIQLECGFFFDHPTEEASSKTRHRRYRWPDEVRDEVMGRLIDLNAQRAREQRGTKRLRKLPVPHQSKRPVRSSDPVDEHQEVESFLVPPPLFAERNA